MKRVTLAGRFAAAVLVVGLLGLLIWDVAHPSPGAHLAGDVAKKGDPPAPPFEGKLIGNNATSWPAEVRRLSQGERVSLKSLRGRVVVLNFWASWCVGCKDEARSISKAARVLRGRAIFLGVDSNDFNGAAKEFMTKYSLPFPSVADIGGSITTGKYGIEAIPETYIVSPRGRLTSHIIGPASVRAIQAAVQAASRS